MTCLLPCIALIITAQLLHEKEKGWKGRGIVMVCFVMVLASHVPILFGSNDRSLYFLARGLQMVGFALMAVFHYRLGRVS